MKSVDKRGKPRGIPLFVNSWITRTDRILKEMLEMKRQDMYLDQAYNSLKAGLTAFERCLKDL